MRPTSLSFLAAMFLCGATAPMQAADAPAANSSAAPAASTLASAAAEDTLPNTVSDARITFAPTDGARFERLLHNQFSVSHNGEPGGLGQIRSQVLERWEKSGEQWLLHCTPMDVSVEESNAPALAIKFKETLLKEPYTVVFDQQGTLVEVRGFDAFPARLKAAFGDEENIGVGDNYPAQQRKTVALSPNYQFNWLYGKRWKTGERYERDMTAAPKLPQDDYWKQLNTITAIDQSIVIVNFENNALLQPQGMPPIHISEKGNATLDTASGQLRQLQKTHLGELNQSDAEGNSVNIKRTEVLSITWTPVSE